MTFCQGILKIPFCSKPEMYSIDVNNIFVCMFSCHMARNILNMK